MASESNNGAIEQRPPFLVSKLFRRNRSRSPRKIKGSRSRSRSRSPSIDVIILPPHLAAHPACFDALMYRDDKRFREAWDRGVEAHGKDWEAVLRWAKVGRQIAPASTEMRFRHAFALERLSRYSEAVDITIKEGDAGLNRHGKELERYNCAITVSTLERAYVISDFVRALVRCSDCKCVAPRWPKENIIKNSRPN